MELKKGDMVEVLKLISPLKQKMYKAGDICEIYYVNRDLIYVWTKDKSDYLYFKEDEIKLIKSATIETQKKQVLRHLQESSITSWEAISKYRITRLADVIYRLRKDHNITKETIREGKKSWAKYTLIK